MSETTQYADAYDAAAPTADETLDKAAYDRAVDDAYQAARAAGAAVEVEADEGFRRAEDELLAQSRKPAHDAAPTGGIEVSMVCAVYEDDGVPPSRYVNPNRNKTIRVFEAKYGRSQPEDSADINWLVWHSLGRPGRNGERPVEPAIGAAEDKVFDEWYDSVEFLHTKTVTRGKVT